MKKIGKKLKCIINSCIGYRFRPDLHKRSIFSAKPDDPYIAKLKLVTLITYRCIHVYHEINTHWSCFIHCLNNAHFHTDLRNTQLLALSKKIEEHLSLYHGNINIQSSILCFCVQNLTNPIGLGGLCLYVVMSVMQNGHS